MPTGAPAPTGGLGAPATGLGAATGLAFRTVPTPNPDPACVATGASFSRTGWMLWLQRISSASCAACPSSRSRRVVYIDDEVVISEKRVIESSLADSCFSHSSMFTCCSSRAERIDHASSTRRTSASSPTAINPARSAVISDCRDHAISGRSMAP